MRSIAVSLRHGEPRNPQGLKSQLFHVSVTDWFGHTISASAIVQSARTVALAGNLTSAFHPLRTLELQRLRELESVVHFNAEVADGAFELSVAE